MSYILDALKKSDRSRQLNTTHEMSYAHLHNKAGRDNLGLKIAVVVLALITITVLLYAFLFRGENSDSVASVIRSQTSPATVQTNSVAQPIELSQAVKNKVQEDSRSQVVVIPVSPEPAATAVAPATTISTRSSLSDLDPPSKATAVGTDSSSGVSASATQVKGRPPMVESPSAIVASNDFTGYENYRSVKEKYGLPDLHLDILMYHSELSKRKAYINMTLYRQGETTSQGAEVMKIGQEGVLLRYSGHNFVLTAK